MLRDKWIKALRSGEYQQGQGRLCRSATDGPKFCCLGVLAEVLEIPKVREGEVYLYKDRGSMILTSEEYSKVGISERMASDLMAMNDSGKTFEEIAEYIDGLR